MHFLQIWLIPDKTGLAPGYEQRAFLLDEQRDQWILIASRDGRDGAVTVHQDVDVWSACFSAGARVSLPLKHRRAAWAQLVGGAVSINGVPAESGDGIAIGEEDSLDVKVLDSAEILVFDLA